MNSGQPTRVIAGCIGLCGFAVALVAGLSVGNQLDVILTRGLVALAGCTGIGLVVGYCAERAVRQQIAQRAAALAAKPVGVTVAADAPPTAPAAESGTEGAGGAEAGAGA